MFNLAGEGRRRRRVDFVDKVGGQGAWECKRFFRKLFSKWEDQDS